MEELTVEGKITGIRGAKAYKKWVPKEWRPEYEAIVALSCTGLNNTEVGKRFGYGKQQVSNILNTPQAKKLREIIGERLREANHNGLGERLSTMQDNALKKLEIVMADETIVQRAPLQVFDRALALLKSQGVISSKENSNNNNSVMNVIDKAMIITNDAAQLLNDGLKKANEVKVIHSGDSK